MSQRRKTDKQLAADRTRRRAAIRRGMKIALYEVQQVLRAQGVELALPPWFIPYTVAIAEGGRRDATAEDRADAARWYAVQALAERIERLEHAVAISERLRAMGFRLGR